MKNEEIVKEINENFENKKNSNWNINENTKKDEDLKNNLEDFGKNIRKEVITIIVSIFTSCTMFIFGDVFFKLVTWNKYSILVENLRFSMFFSVIIFTLLFAITKKTGTATLISYITIFFMLIINEVKIAFTTEPLYFSDVNFLSKIGDITQLVTNNISLKLLLVLLVASAIYLLFLTIIVYLNYIFGIQIKNKKLRISIILIDLVILLFLFLPSKATKEFYLKVFFCTDDYVDFDSYTTNLGFYNRNGFINGMYGTWLNSVFIEPKGYDRKKLDKELEFMSKDNVNKSKNGKPNVIVVFSESFWDIDVLDEIEFNKPITSNFNKLKNDGKLVDIISPVYGGMSENASFELLTGASMNYFSRGYIPIMSLYSRKNIEKAPSIVKNLKNNGYNTEIIFGKDFYNSKSAYLKMGFDKYYEIAEDTLMYKKDKYLIEYLINKLNNKGEGPAFFVLATMEGHMPYSKDKYNQYDISITKSKFSKSINDTILSYAQGLYNSDQQLGVLYEFIQNYEEPTVLLFMGDHLPFMYTEEGKNVIDELKYFQTNDELENNYRLYNPQALILSNYEENIDVSDYLGADMLLNSIVNQLDLELEPYYKWLYETSEVLPGINRDIAFDKNGKLYAPKEITEKMEEIYEKKRNMQYRFFIDN